MRIDVCLVEWTLLLGPVVTKLTVSSTGVGGSGRLGHGREAELRATARDVGGARGSRLAGDILRAVAAADEAPGETRVGGVVRGLQARLDVGDGDLAGDVADDLVAVGGVDDDLTGVAVGAGDALQRRGQLHLVAGGQLHAIRGLGGVDLGLVGVDRLGVDLGGADVADDQHGRRVVLLGRDAGGQAGDAVHLEVAQVDVDAGAVGQADPGVVVRRVGGHHDGAVARVAHVAVGAVGVLHEGVGDLGARVRGEAGVADDQVAPDLAVALQGDDVGGGLHVGDVQLELLGQRRAGFDDHHVVLTVDRQAGPEGDQLGGVDAGEGEGDGRAGARVGAEGQEGLGDHEGLLLRP